MYVKLMNRQTLRDSEREHNSDGHKLDHRAKRIMVVDAFLLIKTFRNQVSFVSFKRTISLSFNVVDPLASNAPVNPLEKELGSRFYFDKAH